MKAVSSSCSAFLFALSRRDPTILINNNCNNNRSREEGSRRILLLSHHFSRTATSTSIATAISTSTATQPEESTDCERTTTTTTQRLQNNNEATSSSRSSSTNTNTNTTNFLGPPRALASLSVGGTTTIGSIDDNDDSSISSISSPIRHSRRQSQITRLSSSPDVFLIRNFISSELDRDTIQHAAIEAGMAMAGTKRSDANSVRTNSYLTWMNPHDDDDDDVDDDDDELQLLQREEEVRHLPKKKGSILLALSRRAQSMLVQSRLLNAAAEEESSTNDDNRYCRAEDVQVAKYDVGGRYRPHHDGYGRFVTVLTYLNGVGGTYFPFANNNNNNNNITNTITCQREAEELAAAAAAADDEEDGKSGLLVVGIEGSEAYNKMGVGGNDHDHDNDSIHPAATAHACYTNIVRIQPGDAVAFYNYDADGEEDWKSLHESLSVPREKWIVTNWFRSEALTGSTYARSLYKSSLQARLD